MINKTKSITFDKEKKNFVSILKKEFLYLIIYLSFKISISNLII